MIKQVGGPKLRVDFIEKEDWHGLYLETVKHYQEHVAKLEAEIERLNKELKDVTYERNDYKRYYDVYYKWS